MGRVMSFREGLRVSVIIGRQGGKSLSVDIRRGILDSSFGIINNLFGINIDSGNRGKILNALGKGVGVREVDGKVIEAAWVDREERGAEN